MFRMSRGYERTSVSPHSLLSSSPYKTPNGSPAHPASFSFSYTLSRSLSRLCLVCVCSAAQYLQGFDPDHILWFKPLGRLSTTHLELSHSYFCVARQVRQHLYPGCWRHDLHEEGHSHMQDKHQHYPRSGL
jgi:hypothetical protein